MTREFEDYENEIEDLHNRLDIAEYDKERLREEVTNLEAKIQALSQEPCEDVVSRDWLKTAIHNFYYGLKHTPTEEDIQAYIDAAPSVTQKSGKWQVVSDGYGDSAYICECSECKDTVWVYKNADRKWKYCPNCGARMESEVRNDNNKNV